MPVVLENSLHEMQFFSFSGAHNIASKSRRIYRSLLIIISVNIGGYFFMYSYYMANYISRDLFKTAEAFWLGDQILAIPLNVSASSNTPILYWTRFH